MQTDSLLRTLSRGTKTNLSSLQEGQKKFHFVAQLFAHDICACQSSGKLRPDSLGICASWQFYRPQHV